MNIDQINFELPNLKLPIVIIIGPPGAGKTAVGKQMAYDLNWDFYDTDALIEKAIGLKIAQIFSDHSEKVFRQLESNLVEYITGLLKSNHNNSTVGGGTIISCGGGLPIPSDNFFHLAKWGKTLCLHAPVSVLLERVGHVKNRPLLDPVGALSEPAGKNYNPDALIRLAALVEERKTIYAQAEYKFDTANQSIEEVAVAVRLLLQL